MDIKACPKKASNVLEIYLIVLYLCV